MTPRTVIKMADANTTVADFFEENQSLRFSRIPIFEGTRDHITGIVLKSEVYREMALDNHTTTLKEIERPILITKRNLPIPDLFEELIFTKNHIALVVDDITESEM